MRTMYALRPPCSKKDATACHLPRVTYIDALNRRLQVMDTTAISLCMENALPIVLWKPDIEGGNDLRIDGDGVAVLHDTQADRGGRQPGKLFLDGAHVAAMWREFKRPGRSWSCFTW